MNTLLLRSRAQQRRRAGRPQLSIIERRDRDGPVPSLWSRRRSDLSAAPGWMDYRLDLEAGGSDAPRIPVHQVEWLHPDGAPSSWELITERPPRPKWLARAVGGLVSALVAVVTALSGLVSGAVAAVAAAGGDGLAAGARLAGIVGSVGGLGVAGRLVAFVLVAVPLARVGWRMARWGVAGVGSER